MRYAGRITGLKDDKGFGFVTPHAGGSRAFVHIKAFQAATRRPVEGDLVSYATQVDAQGRLNAIEVRFAGQRMGVQKALRSKPPMRVPRTAMGAGFLVGALVLMLEGTVPAFLPLAYLSMSGVSWIAYALDKHAAGKRGWRRTPEATLRMLDLLGGWPGGLIAQQQLRHKTVKPSFQRAFWLSVIANLVGAAALWRGGLAAQLAAIVIG